MSDPAAPRAFKTAWFAKAARKAKIGDAALCKAIVQTIAGQADDMGGGVYKKRLANNQYRSIILARGGDYWVYEFLFAKQHMANVAEDDLKRFRAIARGYAELSPDELVIALADGDWIEICVGELE